MVAAVRKLLVHGEEDFVITVPDDAKVTFGPWSPPGMVSKGYGSSGDRQGTLRIYKGTKTTENVIAVFGGVRGFRDLDLEYEPLATYPPTSSAAGPPPADLVKWSELTDEERKDLADMLMARAVDKAAEEKTEDEEEKLF